MSVTRIPSPRANAVTLRTYCRPKDEQGSSFEDWDEVVIRAHMKHHHILWENAGGVPNHDELIELLQLGLDRRSLVAGRTLWLGGTDYAYERACCQFNCSYTAVSTVYDVVDVAWLLLNGCGVGFKPQVGTLHGFGRPIENVRSIFNDNAPTFKGPQENYEEFDDGVWTVRVGDSAQAWAKAIGKLFNPRVRDVDELVLDFSQCRGPGGRLKGYGWICNGPRPMAHCMEAIAGLLNAKAGELLDEIDILDTINHIGQVLSSRRSAQIALMDSTNPRVDTFARAKHEYWLHNPQRRQSNNSELFWFKPSYDRILELLEQAMEHGGDPGIVNAEGARRKAPWFEGMNPCGEILLGKFCNLVTNALPNFGSNFAAMERAMWVIARANYRQTCVDLRDGILQPAWHQTNDSLRLCGVSLTGIAQCDWLTDYQLRRLRNAAVMGAYSMADELGLPRPKAVTTIKPEGTASKICDTTEGIHKPLGRYIHNWINFSSHDPLLGLLESAGYRLLPNPSDCNNVLVCFPVTYPGVRLDKVDGKEVNLEPAVTQFRRYLRFNRLWADHNVSCTISCSPDELPELARAIHDNWDDGFIAVSILRRNDPTKTAADLGHPYLPQEVVTQQTFRDYSARLRPVAWEKVSGIYEIDVEDCPQGVCPVR